MRKKKVEKIKTLEVTEVAEAWEVMVELEEELEEFFQTKIMFDIAATAAAIKAEENNKEISRNLVQQYLIALDQE